MGNLRKGVTWRRNNFVFVFWKPGVSDRWKCDRSWLLQKRQEGSVLEYSIQEHRFSSHHNRLGALAAVHPHATRTARQLARHQLDNNRVEHGSMTVTRPPDKYLKLNPGSTEAPFALRCIHKLWSTLSIPATVHRPSSALPLRLRSASREPYILCTFSHLSFISLLVNLNGPRPQ